MSISGTAVFGERHHQRLAAAVRLDLEKIAGAEIVNRRHRAERGAVRRHRDKADQVGVIERLVVLDRRQAVARHVELEIGELLRGVAVGDAGEPRDEVILRRPQRLDLEAPRAVLALERAVAGDRQRILR